MSNKIRNILFLVGVLAVVVMVFSFDVSFAQLWDNVCTAGYWLVAILALWGVLYVMNACTWRVILLGSGDCPVPFWLLAKVTITAFALNYATPVGLLGGEPYKILELKPYVGVQRASSSVLLFAMMHIFSHFLFWTTCIITYLACACLGYLRLQTGMVVVLALMSVFCAVGIYLFLRGYRNGMVVRLLGLLERMPGLRNWAHRFAQNHSEDLQKIDTQIAALHAQNKRSFYFSLALEYVGRMLQSFELMFVLILLHAGRFDLITFVFSFLILAFTSLFANLLFFIPLQMGGREGGFAMSVAQLGMTAEIGLFVGVICRVREIFWTSLGLLLMKIGNRR